METGTPVRQEEDMFARARQILNDVINTGVKASELAKEVEELRGSVRSLQYSVDATQRKNAEQEALIGDIRRQRDEAEAKLASTSRELSNEQSQHHQTELSYADTKRQLENVIAEHNNIREALARENANLRKERDTATNDALQAYDDLAAEQKRNEAFRNAFENLASLFAPKPAPTPAVEPPKPVETTRAIDTAFEPVYPAVNYSPEPAPQGQQGVWDKTPERPAF